MLARRAPRTARRAGRRQPYSLGVDLADVGQSLGQDVAGHLVAELVAELSSFALSTLGKGASIRDGARHDAADRGGDLEDVGHGRGVDQFILERPSQRRKTQAAMSRRLGCERGQELTGTFFWDRTTAQSLPRMPIDMMLAAVIALKAYSGLNARVSWV